MRDLTEVPRTEGIEIPVEGPDVVLVQTEPYGPLQPAARTGVEVEFGQRGRALSVDLVAVRECRRCCCAGCAGSRATS